MARVLVLVTGPGSPARDRASGLPWRAARAAVFSGIGKEQVILVILKKRDLLLSHTHRSLGCPAESWIWLRIFEERGLNNLSDLLCDALSHISI